MRRAFETNLPSHLRDVSEQFEQRTLGGVASVNEMVNNMANQVEFAEMVRHMGRGVLSEQYHNIHSSAEKFSQQLPRLREQLLYAIKLRNAYVDYEGATA